MAAKRSGRRPAPRRPSSAAARRRSTKASRTGGPSSAKRTVARLAAPARKQAAAEKPDGAPAADELIDMDQAVGLLKTSRPTFYRWLREGKIKGHKLGRQWRFYREDIERFLRGQEPRVDLPADLTPLLKTLGGRITEMGGSASFSGEVSEVQQAAYLMIRLAVVMRASDISVEPQLKADGKPAAIVRHRVDGVLVPTAEIDIRLLPAIVEQWKRMAACDVHQKHRPQDGRIMLRGKEEAGRQLDLRVCFAPAALGETFTVRVLDPSVVVLDLDRLRLEPRCKEVLLKWLKTPSGLILVVGPTGCGKTTVIYACLNHLAGPGVKIMTIEDPVEYMLPGVTHMQLNEREGLTFASAIRAMLRSAPNILMVGEIRNRETLNTCLQASLTGHLVFSTLHTEDASSALVRMVEIGVDPFVVADATNLIVAQRLLRTLCPHCSVPQGSPTYLDRAERLAREGGLDWDSLEKDFREPVGCAKCGGTGYRGRRLIVEMLEVSPAVGAALRGGAKADQLRAVAVEEGMRTMSADGVRLAAEGVTSLAEVLRVWRL